MPRQAARSIGFQRRFGRVQWRGIGVITSAHSGKLVLSAGNVKMSLCRNTLFQTASVTDSGRIGLCNFSSIRNKLMYDDDNL
jgi:hypothetical protein